MKISVNCPSYKRPRVKTLEYLPFCQVWVDNKEYQDYIKANKGFEKNIISVPEGIQGNVSRIRNYILDKEFENGADAVVLVDDDMKGIYHFEKENGFAYTQKLLKTEEFMEFVEKYTDLCKQFGFKLWGVNCNQDKLSYRQTTPFSTLSVVLGPFCCHLKNGIRYDENLPLKEDYDLFIQHCENHRGVLRINKYYYICKQSKQSGGCASYRNFDREKQQLEALQKKWGSDIVKFDIAENSNTKKKRKNIDYNPIIKIKIKGV